ncbi:MAG: YraN family protein [Ruminococcaceae bacterium]|nr:YraN family protein [Oscillospiraceae bacterium]
MTVFDFFKKKKLPPHLLVGIYGEKKATAFLKRKGYKITERNFSAHGKEIDIIAENKDFFVFCEVKTRITNDFLIKKYGRPADAVNYYKQRNIIDGAKIYLSSNPTKKQIRFDVIEVYLSQNKNKLKIESINHMENAFRSYFRVII